MNMKFYALPQAKQDKIWNAALKIFSTCSYKSASTIEIAKEAGISKALLFHYFINKKELYLSAYDYCVSYVISELNQNRMDSGCDFFQVLLQSQNSKCAVMTKYSCLFEFLIRAYSEPEPDIRLALDNSQKPLVEKSLTGFLQKVDQSKFREGVDLKLLLKMLVWCGDGCMREKFQQPVVDPQEINSEFAEVLFMLRKFVYKESAL